MGDFRGCMGWLFLVILLLGENLMLLYALCMMVNLLMLANTLQVERSFLNCYNAIDIRVNLLYNIHKRRKLYFTDVKSSLSIKT